MGAEVQEDVQVLELARRTLEDQVPEGGHAQVSAALQRERDQESSAPGTCLRRHCTSRVLAPLTSSSQYLRITSRAFSVISGASSTTLVKILPG